MLRNTILHACSLTRHVLETSFRRLHPLSGRAQSHLREAKRRSHVERQGVQGSLTRDPEECEVSIVGASWARDNWSQSSIKNQYTSRVFEC